MSIHERAKVRRSHRKRTPSKDTKKALKAARAAGWRVETCKSGWIVYPPNGEQAVPLHASERRGFHGKPNALVQLRRAGLDV